MIDPRRLVAPVEPFGVLIEPDAREIRRLAAAAFAGNREFAGHSLSDLRGELRAGLTVKAPVILTGHQAEFFHAGVFAKIIAAQFIAESVGGTPAFFTVDSDVPKHARLPVPHASDGEVRRIEVPIPLIDARWPVESQAPATAAEWHRFFNAVREAYGRADTSIDDFEHGLIAAVEQGAGLSAALAGGRAAVEQRLGLAGQREFCISELCATRAFRAFALHMMSNAAEFAAAYNAAQANYRTRHRVRTDQRPVPPLKIEGQRIELPFWLSPPQKARRRLFVRDCGTEICVFADEFEIGRIAREGQDLAQPWEFENGFALRPRALALSAFARLFVADLFIHGIGGAKYDEITNEFIVKFFGVAPPALACVSATVYLPVAPSHSSAAEVAALEKELESIEHQPWRHVDGGAGALLTERLALVAESRRLREQERRAREQRRAVYQKIHQVDERLLCLAGRRIAQLEHELDTLLPRIQVERIAASREYFFALSPPGDLQTLIAKIRAVLTANC